MALDPHAARASADDEYRNPPAGSGHEHTDANVSMIIRFAVWLAASAIIVHIVMWFTFDLFVKARARSGPVEFPLAVEQAPRLPAGPRLQAFPANEIHQFRLHENDVLNGYVWVDKTAGTVRIPISEAMRLTVERGLPARTGDEQPDIPGMMPSDSSAGRVMERRRQ